MTNETRLEAEKAIQTILRALGENPEREGLAKTPARVVRSYQELTAGYQEDPSRILSTVFSERCDEMVIVRDIKFWSLCEHHMLPFFGSVTMGYLPRDRIVGLSKMGRLIHCFAKRLQVQERMTQQIAHSMMDALAPHGVGVVVRAHHTCMEMRGVKTPGEMMTSCLLGSFLDPATRSEFLSLSRIAG